MRGSLVKNLIKNAILLLVAVAAVGGTFYLESQSIVDAEAEAGEEVTFNVDAENLLPDYGVMRFDTEVANDFSFEYDRENDAHLLTFTEGRVWTNLKVSRDDVNFIFDGVVLVPRNAVFDLNFDGKKIDLSVYDGDVYIGLLLGADAPTSYVDENYPLFKKRLLVPRDTKVVISLSKLDERIEQLLYSKLVKEFRYSAIPSAESESDWVFENMLSDEKYIESLRQEFASMVLDRGQQLSNDFLDNAKHFLKTNLTFIPSKGVEVTAERLFANLDDAIFYSQEGESSDALLALDNFDSFAASISADLKAEVDFDQKIDTYLRDLLLFGLAGEYNAVLERMLQSQFLDPALRFEVLDIYWMAVYDALSGDELILDEALDNYFERLEQVMEGVEDLDQRRVYLAERNQLYDNLLLRYSNLYKDKYFAKKAILEQWLIDLFNEGQLKREVEQSLVDNKIDFLKRLQKFFFDGEVDVDEAREILTRLIEESQFYLEKTESQVAIVEIFETKLEDLANFGGYLSDPEYYSSSIHGSTHKERFETYLRDSERIWSFVDLQKELLGAADEEVVVTISDIEAELSQIFATYPEISEIDLGQIAEVTQRYVDVNGIIGGYPFTASYDRAGDAFREVYVYEELVSERSVKIASLLPLLDRRFADAVGQDGDGELTEESNARRIARIFISNTIADVGFEIELEDVSVVDESETVYRIEKISYTGFPNILFTFDYQTSNEMANNLMLEIDEEFVSLQGEFTLEELERIAVAEGDFSSIIESEDSEDRVLR